MSKTLRSNVLEGGLTVDPSAGAGVAAAIGAMYPRRGSSEWWLKTGAANTAWTRVMPVPNSFLADMLQATVKGRAAGAGTGPPQDLTQTQLTALVNVFTAVLSGAVPASGGGTTTWLRADATFTSIPTTTLSGSSGWYGTGIDGVISFGAGTTTLARDFDYSTVTVPNGATVITDLYCMRGSVSITVDVGGIIHQDGNTTATATGGAAGGTAGHTYARGGNGGNAGVGAGGAGGNAAEQPKNLPLTGATSGQGGVGGTGNAGANAGGAGGVPTVTTANNSPLALAEVIRGCYAQAQATQMRGGAGGGAGGGSGATSGAGGGGGGGLVVLASPTITNNGTIRANGGAGGNAANNNTGGGGGGGGGKVFLLCRAFTGNTPEVNGGAAGAGLGNGTSGSIGQTGYTFTFIGV